MDVYEWVAINGVRTLRENGVCYYFADDVMKSLEISNIPKARKVVEEKYKYIKERIYLKDNKINFRTRLLYLTYSGVIKFIRNNDSEYCKMLQKDLSITNCNGKEQNNDNKKDIVRNSLEELFE